MSLIYSRYSKYDYNIIPYIIKKIKGFDKGSYLKPILIIKKKITSIYNKF